MTADKNLACQPHSLQVRPLTWKGDTLGPDNGGDSGPDYLPEVGVRRATPRPIHPLRWYRASTYPRLSEPRFGDYYS